MAYAFVFASSLQSATRAQMRFARSAMIVVLGSMIDLRRPVVL